MQLKASVLNLGFALGASLFLSTTAMALPMADAGQASQGAATPDGVMPVYYRCGYYGCYHRRAYYRGYYRPYYYGYRGYGYYRPHFGIGLGGIGIY